MNPELNKAFINLFLIDKNTYTDLTPFTDCTYGFSIQRKYIGSEGYSSLIHIFVSEKVLQDQNSNLKSIYVSITYGRKTIAGISMRSNEEYKISDPIDVIFPDDFFYDPLSNELYRKNKKITGKDMIEYVYSKHIKTTKIIVGFFTRTKVLFWRYFVNRVASFLSIALRSFLRIFSGILYSYEPLMKEETIDGNIIKSSWPKRVNKEYDLMEKKKESKKFNFLQYDTSFWSIIVYSILHMIGYIFLMFKNIKPVIIIKVFENNFLTLIYVIISLFIIEFLIPKILMYLIKQISIFASYATYKNIEL